MEMECSYDIEIRVKSFQECELQGLGTCERRKVDGDIALIITGEKQCSFPIFSTTNIESTHIICVW